MLKIEDIIKEYGRYYLSGSSNVDRIQTGFRLGAITPTYARSIRSDDTVYRAPGAMLGEIIQPFQSKWTPSGDLTFQPNDIKTFRMKVDNSFHPDALEDMYLGFLTDKSQQDRSQWPFVRWFIEVFIIPEISNQKERLVYGKGEYKEPKIGVAGGSATSMNGLTKLIKDGLANESNPMNQLDITEDINSENAFDIVENMISKLDEAILSEDLILAVPPNILLNYRRDRRNTHGQDTDYNSANSSKIDFLPNCDIVGLPSLNGSSTMFLTTKNNFVHITPTKTVGNPIRVESSRREVSVMTDWREGLGFMFNGIVYASFQKTPVVLNEE